MDYKGGCENYIKINGHVSVSVSNLNISSLVIVFPFAAHYDQTASGIITYTAGWKETIECDLTPQWPMTLLLLLNCPRVKLQCVWRYTLQFNPKAFVQFEFSNRDYVSTFDNNKQHPITLWPVLNWTQRERCVCVPLGHFSCTSPVHTVNVLQSIIHVWHCYHVPLWACDCFCHYQHITMTFACRLLLITVRARGKHAAIRHVQNLSGRRCKGLEYYWTNCI